MTVNNLFSLDWVFIIRFSDNLAVGPGFGTPLSIVMFFFKLKSMSDIRRAFGRLIKLFHCQWLRIDHTAKFSGFIKLFFGVTNLLNTLFSDSIKHDLNNSDLLFT